MGSSYAGILGPLAFALVTARGAIGGWALEPTLLSASAALFVFGAIGFFAGHDWRTSPAPFALGPERAKEIETLGRVLLQFYRAVNLLYRKSVEGKMPEWVAQWLAGDEARMITGQAYDIDGGVCMA